MPSLDDKVARLKQLAANRSEIDAELADLRDEIEAELDAILGFPAPSTAARSGKARGRRKCSNCGQPGHNSNTCPRKGETAQAAEVPGQGD